jgi:hypothetical protein
MKNFLATASLALLAACVTPAEPQTQRWSGVYDFHFETSSFRANGSNEAWWLTAETEQARDALHAALAADADGGPWGIADVTIEGTISPPGRYGHLAAYPHEVHVTRVLHAEPQSKAPAAQR